MVEKKVIAIVGATGAQGGGLVRAILEDPSGEFAARAVVRDPSSPAAQELARAGAEVVQGDLDDAASLRKAFEGAYGAFLVTFFWHHMSAHKEMEQARAMAQAAKDAGLQHVIWSTLEDMRQWEPVGGPNVPSLGEFVVPHFDGKGASDHFFSDLGVPTSYLLASFYWDNFIHFGMGPRRGDDGVATLALPLGGAKLPGIAAEDIGPCALGIFKKGPSTIGKRFGISGGHYNGEQMAEAFSQVLGEPVRFYDMPFDQYRTLGFPGADDLGNMFHVQALHEAEFAAARSVEGAQALHPGIQSLPDWLRANASRITIAS